MASKPRKYLAGLGFLGTLSTLAVLVPWLPLPNPRTQNLANQFSPPSFQHWFGTGDNGVDVLSNVLWGARVSLGVGIGSVFFAAIIGLVLGSLAGYFRGRADQWIMRVVDLLYAFPGILLVVALAAVLGPSLKNMVLVLAMTSWAGYARIIRGVTLSLREREFVQAARALGARHRSILVRHIWPNVIPPLVVQMTFGLGSAILTESSLSFLGLGAPPGTPSWGQLLNEGREVITSAPHLVLAPGLILAMTILSLNLSGDRLRDWLDPKIR